MPEFILLLTLVLAIAALFFFLGVWYQKRRKVTPITGGRIEEYPFYPFTKNKDGHIEFNSDLFNQPRFRIGRSYLHQY